MTGRRRRHHRRFDYIYSRAILRYNERTLNVYGAPYLHHTRGLTQQLFYIRALALFFKIPPPCRRRSHFYSRFYLFSFVASDSSLVHRSPRAGLTRALSKPFFGIFRFARAWTAMLNYSRDWLRRKREISPNIYVYMHAA